MVCITVGSDGQQVSHLMLLCCGAANQPKPSTTTCAHCAPYARGVHHMRAVCTTSRQTFFARNCAHHVSSSPAARQGISQAAKRSKGLHYHGCANNKEDQCQLSKSAPILEKRAQLGKKGAHVKKKHVPMYQKSVPTCEKNVPILKKNVPILGKSVPEKGCFWERLSEPPFPKTPKNPLQARTLIS